MKKIELDGAVVKGQASSFDTITLLHAPFPIQKRISFDGTTWTKHPAPHVKHWTATTAKVRSLDDLNHRLDEAAARGDTIAVHGRLPEGHDGSGVLRRNSTFVDQPHRWVVVDLDALPDFPDNPAEAAAKARGMLPVEFREAACRWEASAGHNLVPGQARLRMWFWCDRPVTLPEIRAWFASSEASPDKAVWRRVQPVYLGVRVDGASDPVKPRSGRLRGGVVQVPEIDAAAEIEQQTRSTKLPEGVVENSCHMIVEALGLLSQRDAARIAATGSRRVAWMQAAHDFLDRAVDEAVIEPAFACWSWPDDDAERDLAAVLAEFKVPDAADQARRVRGLGEAMADTWTAGDPLDVDDMRRMVSDARGGRQTPIGAKWRRDKSEAFGAVQDDDRGEDMADVLQDAASLAYLRWLRDFPLGTDAEADAAQAFVIQKAAEAGLSKPVQNSISRMLDAIRAGEIDAPNTYGQPRNKVHKKERTTMSINVANVDASANAIVDELVRRKAEIYLRGNQLVHVVDDVLPPGLGVEDGQRATQIVPVTRSGLWALASKHIRLVDSKDREVEPPRRISDVIFENALMYPVRPITAVSDVPVLMRDGQIISAAGYDEKTGIFVTREMKLPPIPERPSHAQALAALAALNSLLHEFAFEDEAHRAVAVAAMLTTLTRHLYDVVPMVGISAPMPGSGKSYLFRLISELALGRVGAMITAGRDEAECEKRLDALVLKGVAIGCLDNCNTKIKGEKFAALIEQPKIEVRPLGGSTSVDIRNSISLFATGNNFSIHDDMVRRVLIVRLEPLTDRPETRLFASDPLAMVQADRASYVAAAFTIMRGWMTAQEQGAKRIRPALGSFGRWNDLVRSAVMWCGLPDPIMTQSSGRDDNPARQTAEVLCAAWLACFGDQLVTGAEVVKAIDDSLASDDATVLGSVVHEAVKELMPSHRGPVTARTLGTLCGKLKGRPGRGLWMKHHGLRDGSALWRAERF